MRSKSGIKIWIHPPSGEIALSWHVYGCVEADSNDIPPHIILSAYQYVGEAIENKNNITMLVHENYLDQFEFIGML